VSKANKRERQRQNRELAKVERDRLIKRDRRMRSMRGLLFVLIPVAVIFVIIYLVRDEDDATDTTATGPGSSITCRDVDKDEKIPEKKTDQKEPPLSIDPSKTYTALMETSCGPIELELDAKTAPKATNNFVSLSRDGFYDGLPFHRVVKQFVIQGGDPKGDGTGSPGYSVVGEVPTDNYPVGSLAAAKGGTDPPGSYGSQFFIVTGKNGASLPNEYARFGKVTKGIKVAKKIESFAPKAGDGEPTQRVLIDTVSITET
jgi:cyclophilin family peptidyl-prolyl cis-trans isomerase